MARGCLLLLFFALFAHSGGLFAQEPPPEEPEPAPTAELLPDPVSWPEENLEMPPLPADFGAAVSGARPAELAPNPLPPFNLETVFLQAVDPGVAPQRISLREVVQDGAGEWTERSATLQLQERSR
jgi:hypothetical protein